MVQKKRQFSAWWVLPVTVGAYLLALLSFSHPAAAINQIPTPEPKPGAYGLAATKVQDPPTEGARITTPGNNASFSDSPITVSGICPNELLVQLYNNGVMVGSTLCENGSFRLEVSLFVGLNELTAIVYDSLEQAGPTSNVVSVNYSNATFSAFGELITLTSSYGRRSAAAGTQLTWPLQLTGGSGPYAFSLDWGDGSKTELKSQSLAGVVNIAHTYDNAGIYPVNVTVADSNGVSAFLGVVAVANGKVDGTAAPAEGDGAGEASDNILRQLWGPATITAGISLILLAPTFWLGRQSQIVSLNKKMMKERDAYGDK